VLALDSHTLADLEIFRSQSSGTSLFDLCNLTRTEGGAQVLRRRMEFPLSSAPRILGTQQSLTFILEQRPAFTRLPPAYTIARAERYTHEALPAVSHRNPLLFGLGAFALWSDDANRYIRILTGVRFTRQLLKDLREFLHHADRSPPVGEIAPLLEEMRTLLDRPNLSRMPEHETRSWFWNILSFDQVFRLHEKASIERLIELTYEVDALVAMADVTLRMGFVLPRIEEGAPCIRAEGLVHPFLPEPVANPVALDQQRRLLFLTGPNMAGKTTYLRAFATALYLAHLGMGVPARSFSFVPVQYLFSSISLQDDLHNGVSYFRAEALRVKAIAEAIVEGQRVVAVLDEPFKGTNVKDAIDASQAILERFARAENCLFMFSSHLIELGQKLDIAGQIDCRYFEADEGEGHLRFDYRIRAGVSSQRLGMRVLHEEGIFQLLDGDPQQPA
jgi:DNA mismatch repair protein MutS